MNKKRKIINTIEKITISLKDLHKPKRGISLEGLYGRGENWHLYSFRYNPTTDTFIEETNTEKNPQELTFKELLQFLEKEGVHDITIIKRKRK